MNTSNKRTEALVMALDDLKNRMQVVDYSTDTVGTKRVWTITTFDDAMSVMGDFHSAGLSTSEAEAFIAGIRYGSKRKPVGRVAKDNPYRNAIIENGVVEVSIQDADAAEQKRLRTAIFNAAYSLGLKGKFRVRTDSDGGMLVGEVTDKRALRSKQAQAHAIHAHQTKAVA